MFEGRCSQHGVDDGWGMPGVTFDFAADGAPAQGDGVRDGEDAAGETGFQRRYRLLDAETKLAAGWEIGDSFAVLREIKNAEVEGILGLAAHPLGNLRLGLGAGDCGYDVRVEQPAFHRAISRPGSSSRSRSIPERSRLCRNSMSGGCSFA